MFNSTVANFLVVERQRRVRVLHVPDSAPTATIVHPMSNDRQRPSHADQPVNGSGSDPGAAPSQLSDLLHSLRAFNPADPSSLTDIGSLLRSLDQADGMAQGVESRLDTLLDELEGMIGSLEAARAQGSLPDSAEEQGVQQLESEVAETLLTDDAVEPVAEDAAQNAKG